MLNGANIGECLNRFWRVEIFNNSISSLTSKRMFNAWEKVGELYQDSDKIFIAEMNCEPTSNKEICRRFKIKSYPRLIMFKNGKKDERYEDKFTQDRITGYIEEYLAEQFHHH